jgi:hypothetical protein
MHALPLVVRDFLKFHIDIGIRIISCPDYEKKERNRAKKVTGGPS